ncbi:hypothetical protein [Prolixibacter sp. SD074]|jgi:hypothetical protein|uniref:hypothetical protein n=1 Tax=Prolixibacter sp. SD074 TaxID=2652391 RepID=UPI0012705E92|nr:hypothetical protein [Prolixibacter sp. SD074]GET29937.1 hypothetical protein SD074_21390 [Prolixibacter sp. SD074]
MKRKFNYNDLPILIAAQLRTAREPEKEFFMVEHTSRTNSLFSYFSEKKQIERGYHANSITGEDLLDELGYADLWAVTEIINLGCQFSHHFPS